MPEPSGPRARIAALSRSKAVAPLRRLAGRTIVAARRAGNEITRRRARRRHPICPKVAVWAADHGIESREVVPRITTTRRPPHTIEPELHPAYADNLTHVHAAIPLTVLEGATLFGRMGLVMLPDGAVALESSHGTEDLYKDPAYLRHRPRPRRAMAGTYYSLFTWGWMNYYHWVHDSLQRLANVRALLPEETRFLVPDPLTEVQRESLRVLGIPDDRLVPFSGDEEWELERLAFAPPIVWTSHSRRDALVALRDEVLGHYGIPAEPGHRRLFVSRRTATERRVTNEAEVERLLSDQGFETVVCDALSFHDQVRTFAEAAIVVSTHGANLTNTMFSPPGTVIVEMIEARAPAQTYWTIADELDLDYWYLVVESIRRPKHQNDTRVPLDKLARTLEAVGREASV